MVLVVPPYRSTTKGRYRYVRTYSEVCGANSLIFWAFFLSKPILEAQVTEVPVLFGSRVVLMASSSTPERELDILSTEKLNVTLVHEVLWVGRILPADLQKCAWPLLKCLMSSTAQSDRAGFFSFTQDEDELTLIMDEWCHRVFVESKAAQSVAYMPRTWRAFELRLGALAWEVPGVISFLSTLMSEANISILKAASYDRDFLLVQEADVASASRLIQVRGQRWFAFGRSEGRLPLGELVEKTGCFSLSYASRAAV